MPIAPVSDFVWNGILSQINDSFILIAGLIEPTIDLLTPDHPNFIYAILSVLSWIIKLLSSILSVTTSNDSLMQNFSTFVSTYSTNYENFTGNVGGTQGMSYIAKHAYLELTNTSKRDRTTEIAVNFMRALKNSLEFFLKALEMA
ncbi:MAG: hypothetical protein QW672_01130 [Archaeoglobaceae archaeon]